MGVEVVLPRGWEWVPLGTVVDFVNGDRGENYPTQSDRAVSGVPFINTGHIEASGRLSGIGMDYITHDCFERLRSGKVKSGDILYCLRGSTIGKTARNHFVEGAIASSLVIIRAKAGACQDYLYFYLTSPMGRQLVLQHDNGSAQPNISVRSLSNYPLPLPPRNEQRAIAHILGTLDDKIELNRRRNQTLEAMARALFQDWFVDFGPVRAKMEGREPYLPAELWRLFPERLDEAGKPAGWEEVAAEIVADVGIGKTPPRKESQWFSTADTDVPWVSIRDMGNSGVFLQETSEFLTAEAVEKFNVRVVPDNTVILSFKLTVGRVAITDGEMVTNEAIAHLKVRDENTYSSEYLYCYLREFDFGRLGNTSSIATAVNSKSIKALPILVPTNDLVRCFSDRVSPIFTCIKQLQSEAGVLAQLRDTLLPKLISGELRVADAEKFVEHVGP
ncbi:MAG TPA: restriction endonuclease subunit S [Nitrospira sp.]|nr:restriction endonuclease subunit S [Rhodocyclaceae bacterium]MCP5307796.1 restriction endonuclease subunit S [Zoogloeaceae bacterium]HQV13164.1 restriction endonuclease subunit S [Nitrospira sp.]